MSTLHEKSPCCRGTIARYGKRRRQCGTCHKTWSVWKKTRGRKRHRTHAATAAAFIDHRLVPIRKRTGTRNKNQYRLFRSRHYLVTRLPWPSVPPDGDLIAVADALVKYLDGHWHTWYLILVRLVDGTDAVILPPFHRLGTEIAAGWRAAFATIDPVVRTRIRALVCDGHPGLVSEAHWSRWYLQRCHFHLIARLQSRRSKWKTGRHTEEGKRIYALVMRVLTERTETTLRPTLDLLEEMGWTNASADVRKVLSGFVTHYRDYRTYLAQPQLRLPTTNNTAETLVGLIEEMNRRGRGFRTVHAVNEWIIALIKIRKTIRCNPWDQQK